jgi:hypothetical protein
VFACVSESPADEARLQLHAASAVLHTQAADAHAEGMFLEGQSVRVEQLATVATDEEAIRIRDMFVREGLLEIEAGGPGMSSPGGEA